MTHPVDLLVLGAGMVGTSVALAAQERGMTVVLADRRAPGLETSWGNAGLIEPTPFLSFGFPRSIGMIARIAAGRSSGVRYHLAALPGLAGWLHDFYRSSGPAGIAAADRALWPLAQRAVTDHARWMAAAEIDLPRSEGVIDMFVSDAAMAREADALAAAADFGIACRTLNREELQALEPSLEGSFSGGILWPDARSVAAPGAVVADYARLFTARGGVLRVADADTLNQTAGRFRLVCTEGEIVARRVAIALGPWSGDLTARFGYHPPLAVKRGYSRLFSGPTLLSRPVVVKDRGIVMTPGVGGMRLTTAIELANRDSSPSPRQMGQAERVAQSLLPGFAANRGGEIWMGCRPCTPDMLPIIGRSPGDANLWFAFGHNHWGFSLGPGTGQLLAGMIAGELPIIDPAPFDPARYALRMHRAP